MILLTHATSDLDNIKKQADIYKEICEVVKDKYPNAEIVSFREAVSESVNDEYVYDINVPNLEFTNFGLSNNDNYSISLRTNLFFHKWSNRIKHRDIYVLWAGREKNKFGYYDNFPKQNQLSMIWNSLKAEIYQWCLSNFPTHSFAETKDETYKELIKDYEQYKLFI